MHCTECGNHLPPAVRFCPQCGNAVTTESQASPRKVAIQRMHLCKVVLFQVLTLGIYTPVWFLRRLDAFNAHDARADKQVSDTLVYVMLGCSILALVGGFFAGFLQAMQSPSAVVADGVSTLANIISVVLMVIAAFQVRKVLQERFTAEGTPLSGVWTFFFNVLYLQYRINRLTDRA